MEIQQAEYEQIMAEKSDFTTQSTFNSWKSQ